MTEFRLSDSSFSHKVRYNKGMGYFVEGEWIESALHRFECSDGGLRARLGWCAAGTDFPPVWVESVRKPRVPKVRAPPAKGTRVNLRSESKAGLS